MEVRFLVPSCYLVTKSCLDSFATPWTTAHQAPLLNLLPNLVVEYKLNT